jgi:hypothetical protein
MQGMTPNAANEAASPDPLPECRFCRAVGVQTMMRKWCGVPRTVFLHPECEANLENMGVITETWYNEKRMNLAELDRASVKFFSERGSVAPSQMVTP